MYHLPSGEGNPAAKQALLSTRRALRTRKNRRNANVVERASRASPFPLGGRWLVGGEWR